MSSSVLDRILWHRFRASPAHPQTELIKTDYGSIRFRDSASPGKTIIFLCDPPVTVEAYDELFELLSPHYRVLVMELPGFGHSTPASSQAYDFKPTVHSLEQAITALALGPVIICAPCVCGFAAVAMTKANNPALDIRGLVLIQTPDLEGMHRWVDRMDAKGTLRTRYVGQLLVRASAKRLSRFWVNYVTPKTFDADKLAQSITRARGAYPLATMLQRWGHQLDQQTSEVPALIVWGQQDRSHPHTCAASTLHHTPNAEVIELDNCGHFPELENPAQFCRVATPFFERL